MKLFTAIALLVIAPALCFTQQDAPKTFKETFAYGCDPEQADDAEYPSCGVVIALSGLKLREKPAFDAKALAVIPFGETVRRTEKGYDLRPENWPETLMTPDSIRGYWQEITWKDKMGYAFSAFIGDAIYQMNESAYLLFEDAAHCRSDCYASPSYHYYGVFANRDSSRWDLQKIKPAFYHIDFDFRSTSIHADSKKRPAFIVVSKNPISEGLLLTEKKTATVFERIYGDSITETRSKVTVPLSRLSLEAANKQKTDDWMQAQIELCLTEKSSGRKQVLELELYVDKIELVWSGDLDKDGIMDFMLAYSGEHTYGCQLFLSSYATGKELMKPIQVYWFEDCC